MSIILYSFSFCIVVVVCAAVAYLKKKTKYNKVEINFHDAQTLWELCIICDISPVLARTSYFAYRLNEKYNNFAVVSL